MAIFPQAPLPFIITLALWLALCTAGGTLLRYTSSQAFVLSGYTAVVVALLAVPDQDGTFLLAVTRVTETLLAVACVCVVSLLTARPEAVARDYFARIDQVIKLLATHAAAVIRTEESEADFQPAANAAVGRDQRPGRACADICTSMRHVAQRQRSGAVAGQSVGAADLAADRACATSASC